ncbi:MAG: hypothetical protein IE933_11850 [Sphingomonadales bacterium]|nr:hypothetical protein [Sphingomonadales bacterium]MBD3773251.1 hypothetical protein [Paracoccaceae bacterium]
MGISVTRKILMTAVAGAALGLVSCAVSPAAPIASQSAKLWRYFEAKDKLAADLQQHLGGNSGTVTYRLVSINGPAYPVGALISADNPLDLESRACIPDTDGLPAPEPWAAFPSWNASSNLDLSLAVPAHMRGLLNSAQSSLDAGIKMESVSQFQIANIAQVFLSRAELRDALMRPDCRAALQQAQGSHAIFVRGLVYGQETIRSARSLSAGLGVKVMEGETGQFSLRYDRSGAFEMEEQGTSPKFAIVAEVALAPDPDVKSAGWDEAIDAMFAAPDQSALARLSAAQQREGR